MDIFFVKILLLHFVNIFLQKWFLYYNKLNAIFLCYVTWGGRTRYQMRYCSVFRYVVGVGVGGVSNYEIFRYLINVWSPSEKITAELGLTLNGKSHKIISYTDKIHTGFSNDFSTTFSWHKYKWISWICLNNATLQKINTS